MFQPMWILISSQSCNPNDALLQFLQIVRFCRHSPKKFVVDKKVFCNSWQILQQLNYNLQEAETHILGADVEKIDVKIWYFALRDIAPLNHARFSLPRLQTSSKVEQRCDFLQLILESNQKNFTNSFQLLLRNGIMLYSISLKASYQFINNERNVFGLDI